jgi:hypothetical protein
MLVVIRPFLSTISAVAAIVLAGETRVVTVQQAGALPERFERFLSSVVRPSAADRRRLLGGFPITKLLPGQDDKEVAVFGAVWIHAPVSRYVDATRNIESLERGPGFKLTRRINIPPRLEDFADLTLPPGDVDDLRRCRAGDCKVKVDEQLLAALQRDVDWRRSDAQAQVDGLMRRRLHEYVGAYLTDGDSGLPVYRDGERPIAVADQLRALVDDLPALTADMPAIQQYLVDFPRAALPRSTSLLYWQIVQFGLKPTIRVTHVVLREGSDDTVSVSKMLYASHYFWSAIQMRVLIPDAARGDGFWFITINRSRSDGLAGLTGFFVRPRVRGEVEDGALAALRATKARLEAPRTD